MKTFNIWKEGFIIQGGSSIATKVGVGKGETFDDAVRDYMSENAEHKIEEVKKVMFVSEQAYKNRLSNWSVWGCRLFDNASDARKSFG